MKYFYLLAALVVCFSAVPSLAQGNLHAERSSLKGIPSFFVDVTIEGPKHLTESSSLGTRDLIEQVSARLAAAGLPVRPRSAGSHFHVHVNMMEVEDRLVPFSISAEFYQDARLEVSRASASVQTWDEGVVGLITKDRLSLICESVDALADQFAADFNSVNR